MDDGVLLRPGPLVSVRRLRVTVHAGLDQWHVTVGHASTVIHIKCYFVTTTTSVFSITAKIATAQNSTQHGKLSHMAENNGYFFSIIKQQQTVLNLKEIIIGTLPENIASNNCCDNCFRKRA